MLGDLYGSMSFRIIGLIVFIVLGSLVIIIGSFLIYKFRKIKKFEILGIYGKYDMITEAHIGEANVFNTMV